MPMKKRRIALWTGLALAAFAALGPRTRRRTLKVKLPLLPSSPEALQAMVDDAEAAQAGIRPDNQARIVWADPQQPARTPFAIVYLHGFGASQGEGAPVHRELARDFGCNLYLSRLPGHGLEADDAMRGIDAQELLDGAARALAIGRALGERLIVIGTSMGGALALELAAQRPDLVDALVLWSPLVRERDDRLAPMFWPWGSVLLRYAYNRGGEIVAQPGDSRYWARSIHLDGYRSVAVLSRSALNARSFARIRAPVFLGYYYRDEKNQDPTVSVAAMLAMFDKLGTRANLKHKQDFPEANAHVIASSLRSGSVDAVHRSSRDFLQQVVGLPLAADTSVSSGSGTIAQAH
jgi:pimeloyl-ACP methyl ester carboxylesterase